MSTIANVCPIMIYFNALDFKECPSEEVIRFFWRSVYKVMTYCWNVSLRARLVIKNRTIEEFQCKNLHEYMPISKF